MLKSFNSYLKFKKGLNHYLLKHELDYLKRRKMIISHLLKGQGIEGLKQFDGYEIAQALKLIKRGPKNK